MNEKNNKTTTSNRRYFVYGAEGAYDEYVEKDPLLENYVEKEAPVGDEPDVYEEENLKARG